MIYRLWDFPSWDCIPVALREHSVSLIADIPGGCKVKCGYCGKEFDDLGQYENCPHCNGDIVYPRSDW